MAFTEHPSFRTPPSEQPLWRYIDFPRFYFLMTRKRLYLPSLASLTNDPWEGLPPPHMLNPKRSVRVCTVTAAADTPNGEQINSVSEMEQAEVFGKDFDWYAQTLIKHSREMKKQLFVSCWHASEYESEAFWQIYGGRGHGICIRSTVDHLSHSLTYGAPIYGGIVEYLDETKELLGDSCIFQNCLWKRRSFVHEKEFRAVIWEQDPTTSGIEVSVDINSLVDEIIVHPQADEWFVKIVNDLASTVSCKANVRRSDLLSEPSYERQT